MAKKNEGFPLKGALFLALSVVVALLFFFDFSTGSGSLSIKWSSRGSKAAAGAMQIVNHIKQKFAERQNGATPAPAVSAPQTVPRTVPRPAPAAAPQTKTPQPAPVVVPVPVAPTKQSDDISADDRRELEDFLEQHSE